MLNRNKAKTKIKEIFDHENLFEQDWIDIDKLLEKKCILYKEKTGYSKLLTYEFPAICFEGTTIVFSPHIPSMQNQLDALKSKDITIGIIDGKYSYEYNKSTLQKAIKNEFKILYVVPGLIKNIFLQNAISKIDISLVIIDDIQLVSTCKYYIYSIFKETMALTKYLSEDVPILITTDKTTIETK